MQESSRPYRIAVLGDGAWGTALALTLLQNRHQVTLWGPFPENLHVIRQTRSNPFLKGVSIPEELLVEEDLGKAVKQAEILLLAAPSQYLRGTLEKLQKFFDPSAHTVVNIAKGIELGTLKRMSELCFEMLGDSIRYAALSGPSHAEEVARNIPTAVVVASTDQKCAGEIQTVFMNDFFRVYTSTDLVGVELGGALKNVYAVATGITDGMEMGDNPKAAMMTRAIAELSRLGVKLGGDPQTFAGLSGVGDLIVTCMSRHSRNRFVGEALGKGKTLEAITQEMGMTVAEGVKTALSAYELSRKYQVETPIIQVMYEILYASKCPSEAVRELMTRKARCEKD
ncbi:MAG: NAD(P)-dependent glycerol-3-phosphate dehydrogenase [Lentisphaeria bacterium]|nr:NAD(P)-dependent glycerol-3-phosphate dehydrogenase [Lentisphaeria bacterium]